MNAQQFIELIVANGYNATDYSGRGMFGRRCVGVSTDDAFSLIAELVDAVAGDAEATYDLAEIIRNTHQDHLGLGIILYWPRMEWPQEVKA